MRSIKTKLLVPFLFISISALVVCMIVVSLAVRFYLVESAKKDMEYATRFLLNQKADQNTKGAAAEINFSRQLKNLADEQIIYFDEQMKPVIPQGKTLPKIPFDKIAASVQSRMKENGMQGIFEIDTGEARYLASAVASNSSLNEKIKYAVLLYPLNWVDEVDKNINTIILCVFALLTAGILAAGFIIAKRTMRPLKTIGAWADSINKSKYTQLAGDMKSRELEQLKNNLNIMAQRLENADQEQERLLQNISHDLRTPLMSIQGYAEAVRLHVADDSDQALGIIVDESKRLASMVGDILYLSRLEAAGEVFTFEQTDVNAVIKAAAEKMRGLAISQGKEITFLERPEKFYMQADGEKLLSAFLNLMGNCLRYAKRAITVKAYMPDKNNACIEISDDGPGFSGEDLKNLFVRFYKGTGGQHGLGLAITQAVVKGHRGEIIAENKEGGGAMFRVILPAG